MEREGKMNITLIERSPTVEEYQRLCKAVGWDRVNDIAAEAGLHNSLYSVCVIYRDEVIGCGRVIGDGIYFYIQDIMVLPGFQRKGIGKRIMDALMNYLRSHVCSSAFIGLMAAKGASKFYKKYGFVERPQDRPGMFQRWENRRQSKSK